MPETPDTPEQSERETLAGDFLDEMLTGGEQPNSGRLAFALADIALARHPRPATVNDGASIVAAERRRQIEAEGYSLDHDIEHGPDVLCAAAWSYSSGNRSWWPWDKASWKPKDRLTNLIRAGALYQAALDVIASAVFLHDNGAEPRLSRDRVIAEIDALLTAALPHLAAQSSPVISEACLCDNRPTPTPEGWVHAVTCPLEPHMSNTSPRPECDELPADHDLPEGWASLDAALARTGRVRIEQRDVVHRMLAEEGWGRLPRPDSDVQEVIVEVLARHEGYSQYVDYDRSTVGDTVFWKAICRCGEVMTGPGNSFDARHRSHVTAAIAAALRPERDVQAEALREAASDVFDTGMDAEVARWLEARAAALDGQEAGS